MSQLLQQRLSESAEKDAAGLAALPQPLPPALFRRHAEAIGAKAVKGKDGEGAMVWAGGGSWAEARKFVADWLASGKSRFRLDTLKKALHKAAANEPNSLPPDADLKAILAVSPLAQLFGRAGRASSELKDYCELSSGVYKLIGS